LLDWANGNRKAAIHLAVRLARHTFQDSVSLTSHPFEKSRLSTEYFGADHPASSSMWSVRAGMTRSRWYRREAIIPARITPPA
jgi:hypothetical protein